MTKDDWLNSLKKRRSRSILRAINRATLLTRYWGTDGFTSSELFSSLGDDELAHALIEARYAVDALQGIERSLANEMITRQSKQLKDEGESEVGSATGPPGVSVGERVGSLQGDLADGDAQNRVL